MSEPGMAELTLEDIPLLNMGKFLLNKMREHVSDNIALVEGETDKSYTYGQLIDRTELAAAGFQKFGVKKDDVICVVAPNCMDYLVGFYASALIYAVYQPVNPLYTTDDLKRVIKDCNSKYILTVPSFLSKVQEALGNDSDIQVIIFGEVEGYTSFESLLDRNNGPYSTPEADPKESVAALLSSSGTTGFPKAVRISHYNIVANAIQVSCVKLDVSDNSSYIVFMPLFHVYGLIVASTNIHYLGAKVVLMTRFQPDLYLELIQKHKPECLHVVPPIMVLLAKYPKVSNYDTSSVNMIICGAAPLSKEIEHQVKARLNVPCVMQGYGMTEVGVTHFSNSQSNREKSVGQRYPLVDVKIVNPDSNEICKVNEEGEIWVRGPQVCIGYLNRPEENSAMFTEDGWAKTGDIGYEDEDGYLYIVDRLKELIKYKAYQVAPATLEDILLKHDAVADVGVVGMPDEEAGELPRAYVKKKEGKEVTEEELIAYVADKVIPHMRLRGGVEFVTEIERTPSGKILRKSLREKARQLAEQREKS